LEVPVLAQVAGLTVDDGVIARVVAALGSPDRPVGLDRVRIERQMRGLAMDHVAERIEDSAYLERLGQFRVDLAMLDATPRGDLLAKRAVQWLRVRWLRPAQPRYRVGRMRIASEYVARNSSWLSPMSAIRSAYAWKKGAGTRSLVGGKATSARPRTRSTPKSAAGSPGASVTAGLERMFWTFLAPDLVKTRNIARPN
jgi:hypothetical protein